jgi:3-oxoacyl-[acyl-carrier protein] reductase
VAELKEKVAIVTGASRGLGAAVARALADRCKAVVLLSRDKALLASVASGINSAGERAVAMACDVSDYGEVAGAVAETKSRFGRVDILISNAGIIDPIAHIATSEPALWAQNVTINLIGPYNAVRAVLPNMIADGGGSIVNITSGAAYQPLEGWSAYCSSKAGLVMLTRSIAEETSGMGIRIFGFSPGTIDTDMQAAIRASGINPVSKVARADLAPVEHAVRGVLYLCSSNADDLIGQDVSIRHHSFRQRLGLA